MSENFKKIAKSSNITNAELASQLQGTAHISNAGKSYGGKWFAQHEAG